MFALDRIQTTRFLSLYQWHLFENAIPFQLTTDAASFNEPRLTVCLEVNYSLNRRLFSPERTQRLYIQ